MKIDTHAIEPIKEHHRILQVVDMKPKELHAMLPLRVDRVVFVSHPFSEMFGFPIDLPTSVRGKQLIALHLKTGKALRESGAIDARIDFDIPVRYTKAPLYNQLVSENNKLSIQAAFSDTPIVLYNGDVVPLIAVEQHINALAIFCNYVHNKSKLLLAYLPESYSVKKNGDPELICRDPVLHGRFTFDQAADELFTAIFNFIDL